MRQLEKEKGELEKRLEFVEELIGPTEARRKVLQEQVLAARSSALRAKYRGAGLPTKVAGRLDEQLLWSRGLSERDAGLLQGGCMPDKDGILQDVSVLGDPGFRPYDERTGELRWHARGGMLQISLGEVRSRFGEEVADDVVRCAKELDRYDASRRVGVELPWHPLEDRELNPAEIIDLMDRELFLQTAYLADRVKPEGAASPAEDHTRTPYASPYAVVSVPPPYGQGRHRHRGRAAALHGAEHGGRGGHGGARGPGACSRSGRSGSAGSMGGHGGVRLPRVEAGRAPLGRGEARCTLAAPLRGRMQEALPNSLLLAGCHDRAQLF